MMPVVQRPDWLEGDQNDLLAEAITAIRQGVGEKLTGIVLVGPAVKPARHAGVLPMRLIVMVTTLPVATLSNLAHQAHVVADRGVDLRVLTKAELLRSSDVFALELADYRDRHFVLYGEDPFVSLHLTQADLRLAIERQLRLATRAVRHAILGGLREDGQLDIMRERLRLIIDDVVTIADHLLRMLGCEAPASETMIIEALSKHTESDAGVLLAAVENLRTGGALAQPAAALAELAALIDAATTAVDRFGAGVD